MDKKINEKLEQSANSLKEPIKYTEFKDITERLTENIEKIFLRIKRNYNSYTKKQDKRDYFKNDLQQLVEVIDFNKNPQFRLMYHAIKPRLFDDKQYFSNLEKYAKIMSDMIDASYELGGAIEIIKKPNVVNVYYDLSKILLKFWDYYTLEVSRKEDKVKFEAEQNSVLEKIKNIEQKSLINTFAVIGLFSSIGITTAGVLNALPTIIKSFEAMTLYKALMILFVGAMVLSIFCSVMIYGILRIIFNPTFSDENSFSDIWTHMQFVIVILLAAIVVLSIVRYSQLGLPIK